MPQYQLLWGDLHTHLVDFDRGDAILGDARENIDFAAVLCYPFEWDTRRGLRVESVGNRPHFLEWWERLRELARAHHEPGRFVTFLGYEWNGNRTRYGDHNVIYFHEDSPLDDAWSLPDLYANLRSTRALAIPHHTGYRPHRRGKDWDVFDPQLSPVMEVVSIHGSSEGCDTPLGMTSNTSMGPRAAGGTFHDALARGLRVGVLGSNDYAGLPGRWGIGRAAVWAEACTREAIWEALLARRTYAVTGDRIELDFRVAGQPMGSELEAGGPVDAQVQVVGSAAIDRIDLLNAGRLVASHVPADRPETPPAQTGERSRYKVRIEVGWGPCATYGFQPHDWRWKGRLEVEGGRLVGVERCFSLGGQRLASVDERHCAFELVTAGRAVRNPFGMTQAIVAELEGSPRSRLTLDIEGGRLELAVADLLRGGRLVPLIEESVERVQADFGIHEEEIGNPDIYYHNARKVKIHRAVPQAAYRVAHAFQDVELAPGRHPLHVRVWQRNGQLAWSSPIWVQVRG
ncbi:MAG: DUF3604 domain-containing protein [Candidatus Brocadiia bacterium]